MSTVKINLTPAELIRAIKKMKKREIYISLEDLLAATSPVYLEGIKEARSDYKAKRIKTHDEVFGK